MGNVTLGQLRTEFMNTIGSDYVDDVMEVLREHVGDQIIREPSPNFSTMSVGDKLNYLNKSSIDYRISYTPADRRYGSHDNGNYEVETSDGNNYYTTESFDAALSNACRLIWEELNA